jgi:hypothetical protein
LHPQWPAQTSEKPEKMASIPVGVNSSFLTVC